MNGSKLILLVLLGGMTVLECGACTIFYFVHDGKAYFCNNEDWSDPDTEIRFHPAKKGAYAWVYLGFSNGWAQGGVNEKGLCWDWVAGYQVDEAHQEGVYPTRYSNIISISEGKIFLYKSHNYQTCLEIDYLRLLDKKHSKYKIAALFEASNVPPGMNLARAE